MAVGGGPFPNNEGLVFGLDTGYPVASNNTSVIYYQGEPTTNLHPNSEDASLWTGNLFGNWINSAVTSNVSLAPDGTLTADRLGNGYGRFNSSAPATPGQPYTYSVYLKNVSLTNNFDIFYAFGLNGSLVTYGGAISVSIAQISTGNWVRVTTTITAPSSGINQVQFGPCPFTGYGNPSGQEIDVWGGQIEQKNHATPYTASSRGVDASLIDLTRNTTIDVGNVSFNSSGQPTFDGTDDYINLGSLGTFTNFTVETIFKSTSVTNYRNPLDCNWLVFNGGASGYSNIGPRLEQNSSGNLGWIVGDSAGNYSGVNVVSSGLTPNVYHYAAITKTGSNTFVTYYNGNNVANLTFNNWTGTMSNLNIGRGFSTSSERQFIGDVPTVRIYNRALTAAEIQQNYQTYKTRFGI
jgi:hypothetical protein